MEKLLYLLITLFVLSSTANATELRKLHITDNDTGSTAGVTSEKQLKTFSTDFLLEVSKGNVEDGY